MADDYARFGGTPWAVWIPCCTLFDLEQGRPIHRGAPMQYLYREEQYVALTGPGYGVVVVDVSRCRCQEQADWPQLPPVAMETA